MSAQISRGRRAWRLGGAAGLALALAATGAERVARPGEAVSAALAAGEEAAVRVDLPAEGLHRLLVVPHGIDVAVELREPSGAVVARSDGPLDRWGVESLVVEAAGSRSLVLAVRSPRTLVPAGRFTVAVDALHGDDPATRRRRDAERAMATAGSVEGEAATAAYEAARAGFTAAGDVAREAEATHALAALARARGDRQAAVTELRRAAERWRAADLPAREVRALVDLGLTLWELGELDAAEAALVAAGARTVDPYDRADLTNDLCLVTHARGDVRGALPCYADALHGFTAGGELREAAAVHNNLGYAYSQLGEPDRADEHYREAIALRRRTGDRAGEAQSLNNLAVARRAAGAVGEALELYAAARDLLAELGDPKEEAAALHNLGVAYESLGETTRARLHLGAALELRRRVGDRRGEIRTLVGLGRLDVADGDSGAATAHHLQALDLARAGDDRAGEALALRSLGEAALAAGRPADALAHLAAAGDLLATLGDRRGEALVAEQRGAALAALGEHRRALAAYAAATGVARALDLRDVAARTTTLAAISHLAMGELATARELAVEAVTAFETLRAGLGDPQLRAAFLGERRRAYETWIDAELRLAAAPPRLDAPPAPHVARALAVSERSRARSLLDLLAESGAGPAADAPRELALRRDALERRLAAKLDRRQRLLAKAPADEPPAAARELELEIEEVLAALDVVASEVRRGDPRVAALEPPATLAANELRRVLDADTVALELTLGEARSHLFAVTTGAIRAVELPPRVILEKLATEAFHELSRPPIAGGRETRPAVRELSRLLLAPVAAELASHRRVAVIADGALHYVPMAALPAPSTDADGAVAPLVATHEVVELPSLSALAAQRRLLAGRAPASELALVVADPVFGAADPRLLAGVAATRGSDGDAALPRLPHTRHEAEAIAALAPPGAVTLRLGLDADRDAVVGPAARRFRVLHLATHGVFDTARPAASGITLSRVDAAGRPRDGALRLRDVYRLDLGADLVVLSGCRTALGREMHGEGIVGLTRGFLHAGARRVVASLWPVDDAATAELMRAFYRAHWQDGATPAAALRSAQLALQGSRRHRAPYFWAGFVLQGDWR